MTRLFLISILSFSFAVSLFAQEEKINDHPEIQSILSLGKTIQSGEVYLRVNKQEKLMYIINSKLRYLDACFM